MRPGKSKIENPKSTMPFTQPSALCCCRARHGGLGPAIQAAHKAARDRDPHRPGPAAQAPRPRAGRKGPEAGSRLREGCASVLPSPDRGPADHRLRRGAVRQPAAISMWPSEGAAEAFGTPALIDIFPSNGTEAFPTITPDGLELLFARSDAKGAWGYSRRDPASHNFGDPSPLPFPAIPGLDAGKARMERAAVPGPPAPRFLGGEHGHREQAVVGGRTGQPRGPLLYRARIGSQTRGRRTTSPQADCARYYRRAAGTVCLRETERERAVRRGEFTSFSTGNGRDRRTDLGGAEGGRDVLLFARAGSRARAGRMLWMVRIE